MTRLRLLLPAAPHARALLRALVLDEGDAERLRHLRELEVSVQEGPEGDHVGSIPAEARCAQQPARAPRGPKHCKKIVFLEHHYFSCSKTITFYTVLAS